MLDCEADFSPTLGRRNLENKSLIFRYFIGNQILILLSVYPIVFYHSNVGNVSGLVEKFLLEIKNLFRNVYSVVIIVAKNKK